MDPRKVDLVLQYALAVAGERDSVRQEWAFTGREQELGPIHLVKYAYIADLAYAAEHEGETFTGANWHFHHYGPWETEVWKRIGPAMKAIGAGERHFSSPHKDDVVRWHVRDSGLADELERKLPFEISSAVRAAVQAFGNDTAGLLHSVYSSAPMLRAAPGESLRMSEAIRAPQPTPAPPPPALKVLSKTHVAKLRKRVQERLQDLRRQEEEERSTSPPAPTYDEAFFAGRDWLDGLAGESVEEHEGELVFDDSVWSSPARRDPKLP